MSAQMVSESGNGVYGQNAIKALASKSVAPNVAFHGSQNSNSLVNAGQITQTNFDLLSKLGGPVPQENISTTHDALSPNAG